MEFNFFFDRDPQILANYQALQDAYNLYYKNFKIINNTLIDFAAVSTLSSETNGCDDEKVEQVLLDYMKNCLNALLQTFVLITQILTDENDQLSSIAHPRCKELIASHLNRYQRTIRRFNTYQYHIRRDLLEFDILTRAEKNTTMIFALADKINRYNTYCDKLSVVFQYIKEQENILQVSEMYYFDDSSAD
jgi:hypothetical protein